MQVINEVIELYQKSRSVRQAIQQNVKNRLGTDTLVQHDIDISEKIRSLCPDHRLRELHRKLAIALDNEDYETSETITEQIKKNENV
jgi:protein-arginine kinase activator protein McsA